MNRLDAASAIRQLPDGIQVMLEGLSGEWRHGEWLPNLFEATVLYLPAEERFSLLFRPSYAPQPTAMVRCVSWRQVLGFIRRNFPRNIPNE